MYIKRGIEENVRNDGRGRLDYRYWDFKTGVIPSASGSCELTLDKTRVIVAIKVGRCVLCVCM